MKEDWLTWIKKIQAIAQSGLAYTENEYDKERYRELLDIAAEMLSSNSDYSFEKIKETFESELGYATPKLDTRGVVFKDEKILMVREKIDGSWTLPGGWADVGLTPSENVEREVLEEAGFKVKAIRLLGVYDRDKVKSAPPFPFQIYKMFFLCELIGGAHRDNIETDAAEFFSLNEIDKLKIAKVSPHQIKRMFELKNSGSPDFD